VQKRVSHRVWWWRASIRSGLSCCLMVVGVCWFAVALQIGQAQAYTAEFSKAAICTLEGEAALYVLELTLSPQSGESVSAGATLTLSGEASVPVAFAVASSPALLPNPDVASGLGAAGTGKNSIPSYTFTSNAATVVPRTIYWSASFSSSAIAECAGLPEVTYRTTARTVVVTPAVSVEQPSVAPPPVSMPAPPSVQVSIHARRHALAARKTVSYAISCTTSCSGISRYDVSIVRRHASPVAVPSLDAEMPVSIGGAAGGDQQLTHRYGGRALRLLERLLGARAVLKVQISVNVRGSSGGSVQAHATASL
jgi:hypothetical protein